MLRTGLVVCFVVLLAAGCGGSTRAPHPAAPKLPHALAERWAREADAVAAAATAGDGCRAQQLARTLAESVAANSERVPSRLRTPLLASVASLSGRIACVRIQTPPAHGPGPKKPKKPTKPKKHGPPPHGPGHGPDKHGKHGKHGKDG